MRLDDIGLRACLVGLGWWGRQLFQELADSHLIEVVSCVDTSESAAAFAQEQGLPLHATLEAAIAADAFDAVLIATPHSVHEKQCLLAIEHDKAVFCEKPLTLTERGAVRIVEEAAFAGRPLGIGHERRFEPGFEAMADLIRTGALGQILFIDANVSHNLMRRARAGDWRLDPKEAPAGLWTGTGIHLSDLIIASAGQPREVRLDVLTAPTAGPGEDLVRVDLRFSTGIHASVTALSCTPYYGRYTVFGDQGWAELVTLANVDGGQDALLTIVDADGRRTDRIAPANAIRANLEEWAGAVLGLGEYRITGDEIIANTAVLEAISAAIGGPGGYVGLGLDDDD